MPLSFSAATHIGVRREINEDSYCARPDLGLFAVADGVGGHDAGEVASRAAIDAIEQALEDDARLDRTARPGRSTTSPRSASTAIG